MLANKELRILLSILQPAGVFSNITNFSRHLGGREDHQDLYEQRSPALPGTQIRSLWPVAQTRTRPPPAPPPPQSNPSASLRAERCPLLTSDLFRALSCPDWASVSQAARPLLPPDWLAMALLSSLYLLSIFDIWISQLYQLKTKLSHSSSVGYPIFQAELG